MAISLVIIPLAAAFITALLGKYFRRLPDIISFCAMAVSFAVSLLIPRLSQSALVYVYKLGGWSAPWGINLVVDGLSAFMLVTINLVAFMITIFCIDYMEKYTAKWKFYTLFLLMLAGMNGVVLSGDIFNLFVFLEIASVASFALVAYGVEAQELEASFKYIIMSTLASLFILLGIAFLYSYTSTLNMADLSRVLYEKGSSNLVIFVSILFIVGFGLKAAIVPFHAWLPDAHPSAPAPVSAFLSGVLIKALGIYAIIRIFYNVLGVNHIFLNLLTVFGVISIMAGVFLAIGQMDLKRLLAYHSISQVGYIMLGIGLNSPLGILGGLFHLFNHSVFKSLLFLNSGAIEYATGTRNLEEMGGLREKMPVTASTSMVASMAISGIPPFNGFWSKIIIIIACIEANRLGLAVWAVIGSILTLASFMKVQKYAFFGKLNERYNQLKEVPLFMQISMVALAVISIFGVVLLLPSIGAYLLQPAMDALLRGIRYMDLVLGQLL
ncbi:MAG: monovalent cation/H+ antiporter subunit D family protein [Candidatus Omnitrophota bacterium]